MKVGDKVRLMTERYGSYGYYREHTYTIIDFHSDNIIRLTRGDHQSDCDVFKNELELVTAPRVTSSPYDNILDYAFKNYEAVITDAEDSSQSKRLNQGKIQTREIDPSFILGIGEVLTKSRAKYDHFNWCRPTKLSTPYESMMRHILAFQSGEDVDKETGSHHLLHAATNIMFMYYHIINNPEESDDRFFKKDKK